MANEGRDVERVQPGSRLLVEIIKGRSSAAGGDPRNRIVIGLLILKKAQSVMRTVSLNSLSKRWSMLSVLPQAI